MIVERESRLGATPDTVFAWHGRPGAFERLVPPWESARLLEPHPGLVEGSRVRLSVTAPWGRSEWIARHTDVDPPRGFTDVQERGPFASWRHRHEFRPAGPDHTVLVDRIDAEPPLGPLGELGGPWLRRRIRRTLRYRHAVTAADLALHASLAAGPRLTIAISGADGFIGRTLAAMLRSGGHRVVPLVRHPPGPGEIRWTVGTLDPAELAPIDAVIHLAGENISDGRWTEARRRRIRDSRINGTATIVDALLAAPARRRTLIVASAVGFYGNRGDQILTEADGPGTGFLADVVREWESTARRAEAGGIRTAETRFGIVLAAGGGALAPMLPLFRLGLGGPLGSGEQWVSWISLDDVAGALTHVLGTESLTGPINLVAPEPVRNESFGHTLGRVLGRPAGLRAPAFALRLALGGLADEGLLASARVVPERLEQSGYRFRHRTLEAALRHELGRETSP